MLGHRGCRLGLVYPEVTRMQARAIFEAACQVQGEGVSVKPEIMIPLVSIAEELRNQADLVREVAREVMGEYGMTIDFSIGTMIELPRLFDRRQDCGVRRFFLLRHKRSDADYFRLKP